MKIDFLYNIQDEIVINKLKVSGIVIGVYYGSTGHQYQVSYFNGGTRETAYFYEKELSFSAGNEMGFVSGGQ